MKPSYRYFQGDFKGKYGFRFLKYRKSSWNLLTGVLYLFLGAGLSFYWFLLRPLIDTGGSLPTNSSILYLVILWSASTLLALGYSVFSVMQSTNLANEARKQKEELGQHLSVMETELQERLSIALEKYQSILKEKESSKESKFEWHTDNSTFPLFRRRAILWELYDQLLE